MKSRNLILILIIFIVSSISGCSFKNIETKIDENKINIAVSIPPQESFVKAVGGDNVNVITMIPPGNSHTSYQPTPKQVTELSRAQIYFSIGVKSEENNILPKLKDLNKEIELVRLDDIVGEVFPHRYFDDENDKGHDEEDHDHTGKDPHIWLSPKRVIIMIEAIRDELIKFDNTNKDFYNKNADDYIKKLSILDNEIKDTLSNMKNKSFIIYHPAFGYFAEDYKLNMITIEEEGKEATAKRLQGIIDYAIKNDIKFIFYQQEFDDNQAETIAKEIGGNTVKVAPLDPNYLENLHIILDNFKEVLK